MRFWRLRPSSRSVGELVSHPALLFSTEHTTVRSSEMTPSAGQAETRLNSPIRRPAPAVSSYRRRRECLRASGYQRLGATERLSISRDWMWTQRPENNDVRQGICDSD